MSLFHPQSEAFPVHVWEGEGKLCSTRFSSPSSPMVVDCFVMIPTQPRCNIFSVPLFELPFLPWRRSIACCGCKTFSLSSLHNQVIFLQKAKTNKKKVCVAGVFVLFFFSFSFLSFLSFLQSHIFCELLPTPPPQKKNEKCHAPMWPLPSAGFLFEVSTFPFFDFYFFFSSSLLPSSYPSSWSKGVLGEIIKAKCLKIVQLECPEERPETLTLAP